MFLHVSNQTILKCKLINTDDCYIISLKEIKFESSCCYLVKVIKK